MVAQAGQEAAVLVEEQDPGDPGITRSDLEFLDEVEARHALVPVGADPHVPHRQRHVQCSFEGGHRASVKIGLEAQYCPSGCARVTSGTCPSGAPTGGPGASSAPNA